MTPSPRITLLLFAFNQVALVGDAVRACLAQEGEPLEIVLSDDASTDGTFVELQRLAAAYGGPHHVRVRRNAVNLGVGAHYNAAVADCGGQLIVTAAGDDISLPHRVRALAAAWDATGQEVDLLASHLIDMDAQGNDVGVLRVDNLAAWRSPDALGAQTPLRGRRITCVHPAFV
jgi:glycosyltransferase involved in cell wall biosynthesis